MAVIDRFMAKVEINDDGCWRWVAGLNNRGYASFWDGIRMTSGHRFAYETWIGPVPDDHELDHLCGHRWCVRPAHVEPVTHRENLLRGDTIVARHAARTHCGKGHLLEGDNLQIRKDGSRKCATCNRERNARWYDRRRVRPRRS